MISADDVMARAQVWVDQRVPYCGGVRGGGDVLCGGTCNRPAAPWDGFRSDCSGYVSWVWQIQDDPSTDGFMADRGGDDGWSTVAIADLQRGDAIVCDGHSKLFSRFVGTDTAEVYEESDCGLVARISSQQLTRLGDSTLRFSGDGRVYHPIRRHGLTPSGSSGGAEGSAAFVTGSQQHFFAREDNGDLRHSYWDAADDTIRHDTSGSGVVLRPTAMLAGVERHVLARGTSGALEHFCWEPSAGLHHDTWAAGSAIATDPTMMLIGEQQHAWAVDAAGNAQHWFWDPRNALNHDTWGQ